MEKFILCRNCTVRFKKRNKISKKTKEKDWNTITMKKGWKKFVFQPFFRAYVLNLHQVLLSQLLPVTDFEFILYIINHIFVVE